MDFAGTSEVPSGEHPFNERLHGGQSQVRSNKPVECGD